MAHHDTTPSTIRFRAACNFCYQAKVKCSGEDPCSTCQNSSFRCAYSPASRQGRPKGSKNKRKLIHGREAKAVELHERQQSGPSHQQSGPSHQRPEPACPCPPLQQYKSMSDNLSLNIAHDFNSISPINQYLGGSDLRDSGPKDSSCLDTVPDPYSDTGLNNLSEQHDDIHSLKDFNVFSPQVSQSLDAEKRP